MKSSIEEKSKILTLMKENYLLANKDSPVGFKSTHWDVFDSDFARFFEMNDVICST